MKITYKISFAEKINLEMKTPQKKKLLGTRQILIKAHSAGIKKLTNVIKTDKK